jgi:hypothetical protein
MTGRLIGIARVPMRRAPPVAVSSATIGLVDGLEGDTRGRKPDRQVTVLFREGGRTPAAMPERSCPGSRGAPIFMWSASAFRTRPAGNFSSARWRSK